MASKFARNDRGYEENRFEYPVTDNFKCSICLGVLNEPKSCRNNQHYFCSGCILQHLKNYHTCPDCMDDLTPETLVIPPRVLCNCVSELRIKCNHSDRGCPDYVQLGNLQNHVEQCGYAPVMCGNEGCGMEISRKDKDNHENMLCKFRKIECYGCGELKREIERMKTSQQEKQRNVDNQQKEMDQKLAEIIENQVRMKQGIKEALTGCLEKVEKVFDETHSYSQPTQDGKEAKQDSLQSLKKCGPPINHDIIIMGGRDRSGKPTSSVEKYSCKEGRWVDLPPMTIPRASASSVVVDNQVIVSGGQTINLAADNLHRPNSHAQPALKQTDSIEILHLDQIPLCWVTSAAKLCVPLAGHQTFVYKGKLIVLAQYYDRQSSFKQIWEIFEVLLAHPYSAKTLWKQTISYDLGWYAAELVNGKIFIFHESFDNYQNIALVYDLLVNQCHDMPSLPFPVCNMSTVIWRNQIIFLGGCRKERKIQGNLPTNIPSAQVIMYNTETGESEMLPAMKHKRGNGCSAVLTDDVIVVMGGHYNSVELYDFRTNTWRALRHMKEIRENATAVVCPLVCVFTPTV